MLIKKLNLIKVKSQMWKGNRSTVIVFEFKNAHLQMEEKDEKKKKKAETSIFIYMK